MQHRVGIELPLPLSMKFPHAMLDFHGNCRRSPFFGSGRTNIRDAGILHHLLGIETPKDLLRHPKVGASWERFVIEQLLLTEPYDEAYSWATHQGAEIALVLRRGECKRTDSPKLTPSIRIAAQDLGLSKVAVLYPGTKRFPISERVEAIPARELQRGATVFELIS